VAQHKPDLLVNIL